MRQDTPEACERDFCTRVRPLLISAVFRCNTYTLKRRGWSFVELDPRLSGYRIRGRPDDPSIRWSLLDSRAVQVMARPGQLTITSLASFDADMAERVVGAWWAAVKP